MADYDVAQYKSSDVARACGMKLNTFRTYFKRGQFRMLGQTDKPAETHGLPHLFSLRDAMGFAVAAELIRTGTEAAAAWQIGMIAFAHSAEGDREPARLFDGPTFLVTWTGLNLGRVARDTELTNPILLLIPPGYNRVTTAKITSLADIERRVFWELDVDSCRTRTGSGK